ncbi:MAG: hypothetical protein NC393_01225 [Clostridium sp.]|nr:hypothetical protein [Clostridium sp.]
MKKKSIFMLISFILVLTCSACTRRILVDHIVEYINNTEEVSEDNIKINVVVGGVDGGILNGARVCEWEGQYAYYDDGMLYYFEDKDSEAQSIQCPQPFQMAMYEDYIYYINGEELSAIDLKSMETHNCFLHNGWYGINVYSDGVLAYNGFVYDVQGLQEDYYSREYFLPDKKCCVNRYDYPDVDVFINGKLFEFYRYNIVKKGDGYEDVKQLTDEKKGHAIISPEHVVEYEGKLYLLLQISVGHARANHNNMEYRYKMYDQIVCFDPVTETSESIYKTPGTEEQIVNFSVENNEMYLLTDGILYKTDLKGEGERVELANYVGADTLTFEYANDTLFVYDGYKLLGQYK